MTKPISNTNPSIEPNPELDEFWMKKALAQARIAAKKKEVPVGAIIINTKTNKPLCHSHNLREVLQSPIGHAEVIAIHRASQKLKSWRLSGYTLYVTLEPCVMCCGAIIQSRIDRVVFGTFDQKGGATSLALPSHNHHTHFHGCVLEQDCRNILKDFFKNLRATKNVIHKENP